MCQSGYHGNGISCVSHFDDQQKANTVTGDFSSVGDGIGLKFFTPIIYDIKVSDKCYIKLTDNLQVKFAVRMRNVVSMVTACTVMNLAIITVFVCHRILAMEQNVWNQKEIVVRNKSLAKKENEILGQKLMIIRFKLLKHCSTINLLRLLYAYPSLIFYFQ